MPSRDRRQVRKQRHVSLSIYRRTHSYKQAVSPQGQPTERPATVIIVLVEVNNNKPSAHLQTAAPHGSPCLFFPSRTLVLPVSKPLPVQTLLAEVIPYRAGHTRQSTCVEVRVSGYIGLNAAADLSWILSMADSM